MPGEEINTTLRFNADITDFKAAMQEAKRATKLANSEFKSTASLMTNWADDSDGLNAKLKQLNTTIAAEERKLDVLKAAHAKVVREQGKNSAAAIDLETQINDQQAAVNKATLEHIKYSKRLKEVEKRADSAGDDVEDMGEAAKDAGEAAEDSGDGWTILKDVIADFVSNAISGAIDAISNAAEATREYRREMAQLKQNAANAGVDANKLKGKLADVAAVTGETDSAMEGLNMLMASGLDTDQISFAADALTGAATKFDGVKFEGMAEGLQETLATGEAVGPFAELIERSGGSVEAFNAQMGKAKTAAEKQQVALKWLADSGLKDVRDAYVANNADLVAAEKAQFRYNDAMAAVGAAIEPVQTAFTNIGATILEKVAPAIESVITWLSENMPIVEPIVIGLATAFGVLAAALAIQGIINGVTTAIAFLNTTLLANPIVLIVALIAGLVAAFVVLWNKSEAFRNFFLGVWDSLKAGVSTAVTWISTNFALLVAWFQQLPTKIYNGIVSAITFIKLWATNLYNTAKTKISEIVSGVVTWFKALPSKIYNGITSALTYIILWATNIYNTAKTKVSEIVSGVSTWFAQIPTKVYNAIKGAITKVTEWGKSLATKGRIAAGDLVSAVTNKVTSLPGKLLTVGKNLVSGLWNGVNDKLTWLKQKLSSFTTSVLDSIKSFFGINSPSKETAWQGEMLVAGYVDAINAGKKDVAAAMQGLGAAGLDSLGASATASGAAAAGGKTINLYQTNNSPRALSRREIYRQTHNALAYAGGV